MFNENELLLILEMRFNSLDWTIKECKNGRIRADSKIRQQEVHFLIEHIKNKVLINERRKNANNLQSNN